MKRNILIRFLMMGIFIILLNKTDGIAQEKPIAFLYVKEIKVHKVVVKHAGENEWQEVNKYGQLFPNDSLIIPEKAKVIIGDIKSEWQEHKGYKVIVFENKSKKTSDFGRFVNRLYGTFVEERKRRPYAMDASRSVENLMISLPDTVFAFYMPESIHWLSNEPWWTEYHVTVTHNKKTVLDTIAFGNSIQLDQKAEQWTQSGYYQINVSLTNTQYLESNADSCLIYIPHQEIAAEKKKNMEELKVVVTENEQFEDYYKLANFYMSEKLYLELENTLIQMIKKFPDNLEPQMMLYAYYSAFLPPKQTEQMIMHRKD